MKETENDVHDTPLGGLWSFKQFEIRLSDEEFQKYFNEGASSFHVVLTIVRNGGSA